MIGGECDDSASIAPAFLQSLGDPKLKRRENDRSIAQLAALGIALKFASLSAAIRE
jgi:hypothetical protein